MILNQNLRPILDNVMTYKKPTKKYRLDHRNYGDAWYLKPTDWEQRYHKMYSSRALKHCIKSRESARERSSPDAASPTKQSRSPREGKLITSNIRLELLAGIRIWNVLLKCHL